MGIQDVADSAVDYTAGDYARGAAIGFAVGVIAEPILGAAGAGAGRIASRSGASRPSRLFGLLDDLDDIQIQLDADDIQVGYRPFGDEVGEVAARGIPAVTRASSRALGQALEAAGHVRPAGSAAHHIVAGNARAASQARGVLQRFGIGVNDAANGVFLPASRAAPNAAGAAVHSTVHTNAYYQTVNQMLGAATTRAEAEAALGAIRQSLLSGGL
jgi:hypothetical protein